jgi:hypothetical protein
MVDVRIGLARRSSSTVPCSTAPTAICIERRSKGPVRNEPKKQDPEVLFFRYQLPSLPRSVVVVVVMVMSAAMMVVMVVMVLHELNILVR